MIPLTLAEIAEVVGGDVVGLGGHDGEDLDLVVTGAAFLDSRSPVRDGLFDAAMGRGWPGAEVRAVRNRFFDEWRGREQEAARRTDELRTQLVTAYVAGDMETFPAMAGQGCGSIRAVVPAAQVVRDVVAEAEQVLRRIGALAA